MTGTASARQASEMPRTASRNCQEISGRSGLPKLRQSVSPTGSAPTPARVRTAPAPARVAPPLAPGLGAAPPRGEVAVDGIDVAGHGEPRGRPLEEQHRGVAARALHRVGAHGVLVLLPA